jgi:hypothetical protein
LAQRNSTCQVLFEQSVTFKTTLCPENQYTLCVIWTVPLSPYPSRSNP